MMKDENQKEQVENCSRKMVTCLFWVFFAFLYIYIRKSSPFFLLSLRETYILLGLLVLHPKTQRRKEKERELKRK